MLDGLPRDWPHDMAPGANSPQPYQSAPTSPAGSSTDSSTPYPASTTVTDIPNAEPDSDSLPPPLSASPQHIHEPLPEPLQPVGRPTAENDDGLPHFASEELAVPPASHRVRSKLDDPGIKDLGWDVGSSMPPVLVRDISNEEMFMLIRRFNKVRKVILAYFYIHEPPEQQVQYVRSIPSPPPGSLDLETADDEEFSPDKLRANIERFYMTVVRTA